jgi:hypothetical protein
MTTFFTASYESYFLRHDPSRAPLIVLRECVAMKKSFSVGGNTNNSTLQFGPTGWILVGLAQLFIDNDKAMICD